MLRRPPSSGILGLAGVVVTLFVGIGAIAWNTLVGYVLIGAGVLLGGLLLVWYIVGLRAALADQKKATTAALAALAEAQAAHATGAAHGADVEVDSNTFALTTPGPWSSGLPRTNFRTHGRRHFAFDGFHRRPKALRFTAPQDVMVRPEHLPVEIPCGDGRLVVEKFYDEGFVIDEDGTVGDSVALIAYFDDPSSSAAISSAVQT